ncbi:class I glutamine amidotransferase-like protein [Pestalotiopsis sp. NC0098]|nr:class I glutamine amidotransferase-like protein [Pestalotiopsis sp. NC0098]
MTVDTKPRLVRVAVFECLELADNIAQARGQFNDVFAAWLHRASLSYNEQRPLSEQVQIESTAYRVIEGQYPPSLDGIDAIIVSGSTASAYDQDPWIVRLAEYLRDVYTHDQRVRLFGGCFGHQLMVQTLLRDSSGFVEKSPEGWEIGVHQVTLNHKFKAHFPVLQGVSDISCQFLHADHAVLDEARMAADGWVRVGASPLCGVQGVYKPGKVLTFQGHPEFDGFLNEQGVRNLEKSGVLNGDEVKTALDWIHRDDDAILHGEVVIDFMVRA